MSLCIHKNDKSYCAECYYLRVSAAEKIGHTADGNLGDGYPYTLKCTCSRLGADGTRDETDPSCPAHGDGQPKSSGTCTFERIAPHVTKPSTLDSIQDTPGWICEQGHFNGAAIGSGEPSASGKEPRKNCRVCGTAQHGALSGLGRGVLLRVIYEILHENFLLAANLQNAQASGSELAFKLQGVGVAVRTFRKHVEAIRKGHGIFSKVECAFSIYADELHLAFEKAGGAS